MQALRAILGVVQLLGEQPDASKLKQVLDHQGRSAVETYQKWANLASGIIGQLAKASGGKLTAVAVEETAGSIHSQSVALTRSDLNPQPAFTDRTS